MISSTIHLYRGQSQKNVGGLWTGWHKSVTEMKWMTRSGDSESTHFFQGIAFVIRALSALRLCKAALHTAKKDILMISKYLLFKNTKCNTQTSQLLCIIKCINVLFPKKQEQQAHKTSALWLLCRWKDEHLLWLQWGTLVPS